jgi:hypothetical protein
MKNAAATASANQDQNPVSHADNFLLQAAEICRQIDRATIEKMAEGLAAELDARCRKIQPGEIGRAD